MPRVSTLDQLHASVFGAAFLGGVVGQGLGLTQTGGLQPVGGNALGDQRCPYGLGAGFGELLVVSRCAGIVGMACHGELQGRATLQQRHHFGQRWRRFGFDAGSVGVEIEIERSPAVGV